MASVRKRTLPSGKAVWQVDYADGAGKRRSRQFRTKREATEYETQVRAEVKGGVHVADGATGTVQRAYDMLIKVLKADGAASSTLHNYDVYYRGHVGPFLADRLLTKIAPADVQGYLDDLRQQGRTADTIRRVKNVLGAVYDEAIRQRLAIINPVRMLRARRRMRRAAVQDRTRVVMPERDEVRRLIELAGRTDTAWIIVRRKTGEGWASVEMIEFDAKDTPRKRLAATKERCSSDSAVSVELFQPQPWLRPMLATWAFAGLRIGESRGLRWPSIGPRVVNVETAADRTNSVGEVKTAGALRLVPIGPFVQNTLAAWRKVTTPAGQDEQAERRGLVFPSETGGVLTYSNIVNRAMKPLQFVAGMLDATGRARYTPHEFRHFAVSLWIAEGADVKQVSEWAGHESPGFTAKTYWHLFAAQRDGQAHMANAERSVFGGDATPMQHGEKVVEKSNIVSIG